ncbi:MAG: hypothetical protein PF590_00445 [Candidatus Delongbacteria bacterium]|nr:hypothetical protein [Candidatus Delongbacteria bacterium]
MKKSRFIIIPIIALLVCIVPVYFITKSGINTLNSHFLRGTDEPVSRNDIEYEDVGFLWQKGNPAVSFNGLLIRKPENSNDTLFYAEHVVISTDLIHKSKSGTGIKIILLSPQIHMYPGTVSGSQDMPEMPGQASITSTPTILVANLSIHYHTEPQTKVIEGIHLKAEPGHNNIHIQAKHRDSPNYVFHGGTHFSARGGRYCFDSSYINLNDVRLMNLNMQIHPHRRSATDISWEAWLDSTRLDPLSTDSLQLQGYLAYHSSGKHTENTHHEQTSIDLCTRLTTTQGSIDTLTVQMDKQQNKTLTDNSSASLFTLYVINYPSYMHLKTEHKHTPDTLFHIFQHRAAMKLADFNIFNVPGLQGNMEAGYRYASYGKTKRYISGDSKANIQWDHNQKTHYLTHHAGNTGSEWMLTNSKHDASANIQITGWFNHLFHDAHAIFDMDIYTRNFHIPGKKTSPQISLPDSGTEEFVPPGVLKNKNISLSWQSDSLYQDSVLLATGNTLQMNVSDNAFDITIHSGICGNIRGPIDMTMQQTSPGNYSGSLSSPGLEIADKSRIPLISKNLTLPPSKGTINAFTLPYSVGGKDAFLIEKTTIRTSDFLLHINGNGNTEDQHVTLGLTAPAGHFKGPAKRILKQKTLPSDSSVLNTVIFHVDRTNGKIHIKTQAN